MKFRTVVQTERGLNATGLVVPEEVVAALGKRAPVVVTLNGYSYRSTIMVMGGEAKLPLALVHRTAAGVEGGQEVEVEAVPDTAPREVVVPEDLAAALRAAGVEAVFAGLAFTHRKEHVRAVEEAKTAETRARRIAKAVEMVQGKA
jgi:Bacteriocin-protection, YdeI or OmpD-Associated/Domain of unknown function (DUF1905)